MRKAYCFNIISTFAFLLASTGLLSAQTLSLSDQDMVGTKGKVWYVSGKGNDEYDGRSLKNAFRSLKKAAGLVQPGDKVLIGNGTYSDSDTTDDSAVLLVKMSGTPKAWILWQALPGQHPVINPIAWAGIHISGSYHIFDGLTIMGNNDAIVLADALKDEKNIKPNPYYNTNGIFINGRNQAPDSKPHHIIIRNCIVEKCSGGGIAMIESDYVKIEDCLVFENAWFMRYGGSGISTLNNWAYDEQPGYHVIIQRNKVWNNKTLVPWSRIGKLSDGNGIILDVTNEKGNATNPNNDAIVKDDKNTKPADEKPKRPVWNNRALIANNLSAYNGGSGIHTFRTRNVDIINNTTYWNGQIVGYQELFANNSENIKILNNIIVPKPNGKITSDNKNTNVTWDYNLYPTSQSIKSGPHDLVGDPAFIYIDADLRKANFKLSKGSPGIDSGINVEIPAKDLSKISRPVGKGVDRGCYEQ